MIKKRQPNSSSETSHERPSHSSGGEPAPPESKASRPQASKKTSQRQAIRIATEDLRDEFRKTRAQSRESTPTSSPTSSRASRSFISRQSTPPSTPGGQTPPVATSSPAMSRQSSMRSKGSKGSAHMSASAQSFSSTEAALLVARGYKNRIHGALETLGGMVLHGLTTRHPETIKRGVLTPTDTTKKADGLVLTGLYRANLGRAQLATALDAVIHGKGSVATRRRLAHAESLMEQYQAEKPGAGEPPEDP